MDVSPSVERMIAVLKRELRARGFRYRDVASRLGVSEITVKRYLSGRGLALASLERMAGLVDLDVLTLASLAKQDRAIPPDLSKAQQAALSRNRQMAAVFLLLVREWNAAKIARELRLSQEKVEALFAELEGLSLIRRNSNGGAIVLAKPNKDNLKDSQLLELWRERASAFLREIDLSDENCQWVYNGFRLSPASARKLKDLIGQFLDDVKTLDNNDSDLPAVEVRWHRLFVGAQPTESELFDRR